MASQDTLEPERVAPPYSYAALFTVVWCGAAILALSSTRPRLYTTALIAGGVGGPLVAWALAEFWSRRSPAAWTSWWPHYFLGSGLAALAVAVVWQLPAIEVSNPAALEDRHNVRIAVLTALGGAALLLNWLQAERQHRLQAESRRLSVLNEIRAKMLSSSEVDRTAALFVLGDFLGESEQNKTLGMAMLAAFVVDSLKAVKKPPYGSLLPEAPASTQAALELLSSQFTSADADRAVKFTGLQIRWVQVPKVTRALLTVVHIDQGAIAYLADSGVRAFHFDSPTFRLIERTQFVQGVILGGDFARAVLQDVTFTSVTFVGTDFHAVAHWGSVTFSQCTFVDIGLPENEGISNLFPTVMSRTEWDATR
jgi:hypothetical protein